MNISFDWLKQYVELGDMTPKELDDLLTFSGLEIENIEKVESIRGGLEHVVIAQVLTCEPHPDSDHLHLTTVDVKGDRPLNIVCGAPNVAAGQKVVCAMIGTKIYTSDTEYYEIKKGKLRGAVSEGMLCAADELQLGSDHAGIMVLPDDAPVGMPAKEYFGLTDDYVLEVAITANRSDATSHIGVARDVVAVRNTREGKNLKIQWPEVPDLKVEHPSANPIHVTVEEPELCPRYTGITLENVHVQDSPEWLQTRLRTVGIRPINNIVDITNFVLMEVGQPLHAFDADKITGNHVVVRTLPEGTPFVTLDGIERKLDHRDLMICNAGGGDRDGGANEPQPMCIAGVFGGEKSGITEGTTRVFLESAYFNPTSIRKTSKRHGLKTDASFRYERGCDPNITPWALRRAVGLMQELAGAVVASEMTDIYPTPIERATVELDFARVDALVGQALPREAMKTALRSLDIEIVDETANGMSLRIPTCKVDVYRECDVVEEIMRIYGYNNIHFEEEIHSCLSYSPKPNPRRLQNIVSDLLTDNGFSEIMNNSLTKAGYYEGNVDFPETGCVRILNPLSKELNVMRQTLLYGGMESIMRNINHKLKDLKLYEFGRSYQAQAMPGDIMGQEPATGNVQVTDKYRETQHLSIWMTGNLQPESWKVSTTAVDIYHLKGHVMNILRRMRMNITRLEFLPATERYYTEGVSVVFRDSHKELCSFGLLNKEVLRTFDCKQPVYYADIDWTLLLKSYPTKEVLYAEVPNFPEVRRDLALVLEKKVAFADIERVAYSTEKKLLKRVGLFDVYEGKGITEGMKSYAVSFILQDREKTLTDKQIEAVMAKLQKNLETQLGATVRN